MSIRTLLCSITGGLLVASLAAVAPARLAAQNATVLPEKAKSIVLVGCFEQRNNEHNKMKYVIVNPSIGPATAVPNGHCTSTGSEPFLELDDVHHTSLDNSMLGQWIEVSGKLNKQPVGDDFRELELKSARLVPVVPPPVAQTMPAQEQPQAQLETTPAPIGTTGVQKTKELPKTASSLPLIGLLCLIAFAGAAGLHVIRQCTLDRG